MANKRDAIFDELQIAEIKAIIGQSFAKVGSKLQYTETPTLNNGNDIPNWDAVLSIVSGGLSDEVFGGDDLDGGEGDYYLPYIIPDNEAILVMRVDYDDQPSQIFFPQYSFEDEAILGFVSKDNITQIKVWSTGASITPPPTPPAPTFTTQPQTPVSVLQSKTLTLSVVGTDTFAYQWYKDGVAISGATSSTLTISNFLPANAGTYYVIATGTGGSTQSANSIVTNDAGILVNNFTSQDLNSGSHAGVTIVATDGTDTVNIAVGTQARLRSGVTITISGYGVASLVAQDGNGVDTNMSISSQAFNSPIASPLSVYTNVQIGTCYTIGIPNSELVKSGQDLYITVKLPGQPTSSSPYFTYLSVVGDPSQYTVVTCSEIEPTYKYGPSGSPVSVPGILVTTGGSCSGVGECSI